MDNTEEGVPQDHYHRPSGLSKITIEVVNGVVDTISCDGFGRMCEVSEAGAKDRREIFKALQDSVVILAQSLVE